MRGYITIFWMAKDGSSALEYEDAVAVMPERASSGEFAQRQLRLAVADGASEAVLARRWAATLVSEFVAGSVTADLASAVSVAVTGWDEQVAAYRVERDRIGRPIDWYEEPGLDKGAYATIVAARFADSSHSGDEGIFDAWALGDACLFQIRDDEIILAFPLDDPAAFGTSPALVPSRPHDPALVAERIVHQRGQWRSGDAIYVMTDALAHWFLANAATGDQPWKPLCDLDTADAPGSFAAWVEERRSAGELRNDDTTLLRLDVG